MRGLSKRILQVLASSSVSNSFSDKESLKKASRAFNFMVYESTFFSLDSHRARKIRAHSRMMGLELEVLRPENLVQSQLCA